MRVLLRWTWLALRWLVPRLWRLIRWTVRMAARLLRRAWLGVQTRRGRATVYDRIIAAQELAPALPTVVPAPAVTKPRTRTASGLQVLARGKTLAALERYAQVREVYAASGDEDERSAAHEQMIDVALALANLLLIDRGLGTP